MYLFASNKRFFHVDKSTAKISVTHAKFLKYFKKFALWSGPSTYQKDLKHGQC